MFRSFDRFPAYIVIFSVLQAILIYFVGAVIILHLGSAWSILYVAFCLWGEVRIMHGSCTNCFYFGKVCAFGRGWLSARIFRRGDPGKFNARPLAWSALIPDLLVSLLPIAGGSYALIRAFSWPLLSLMVLLVLLAFPAAGFIRSQWACAHCRQRELGCPAERLFESQANKRRC